MTQVSIRSVSVLFLASFFILVGCGSSNGDKSDTDAVLGPDLNGSIGQPNSMMPVSSANESPSGAPPNRAPAPPSNASAMDQVPVDAMDSPIDPSAGEPMDPPPEEPMDPPPAMQTPQEQPSDEPTDSNPSGDPMGDEEPPAAEMQPDENVDRPAYPMGPSDIAARRACALLDEQAQEIEVVELEGEAGQVLLTPQPQTAFTMTIPDSGFGYVTLEVPDWAITIAAFAYFEQTVTILDPDGVTEEVIPLSWNGACPDKGLTDQRTKYHSWGSFTVKVEGEPNTEMTLSFIKQN